jgi:SEC-C motif-containing protein
MHCPCCSTKDYAECCATYLERGQAAHTPEALMRSRYTAYTQGNIDYLARTMKSPAADKFDIESTREWAANITWLKLEVMGAASDGDKGFVEFAAYFSQNNKKYLMHELSQFHLENGLWYYVDGVDPRQRPNETARHVGRNQICACGSGKKFKKCCGSV